MLATTFVQAIDPVRIVLCLVLHLVVVRALYDEEVWAPAFLAALGCGFGVGLLLFQVIKSMGRVNDPAVAMASFGTGIAWSLAFWALHARWRAKRRRARNTA